MDDPISHFPHHNNLHRLSGTARGPTAGPRERPGRRSASLGGPPSPAGNLKLGMKPAEMTFFFKTNISIYIYLYLYINKYIYIYGFKGKAMEIRRRAHFFSGHGMKCTNPKLGE